MKLEPNPRGQENFLFVNALNEWAEGNVLEPSMQWGDKYSRAFREAMDTAESFPWRDDLIKAGEDLEEETATATDSVDVCVIIPTSSTSWPWQDAFDLPQLLRSLQAQSNKRWRAVVTPAAEDANRVIMDKHVLDTFDPRITLADVPAEIFDQSSPNNTDAVDWVVENMGTISPGCVSASYMLIANSSSTYEPGTFDLAAERKGDIIGFDFVSEETMAAAEISGLAWNQRCTRLSDGSTTLSRAMSPTSEFTDVGAAFINLARWRGEGHVFGAHHAGTVGAGRLLQQLSARPGDDAWSWAPPLDVGVGGLVHGATYTACIKTGRMWFDVPSTDGGKHKAGCYNLGRIISEYGWTIEPWDMARFKEDPFCMRMSQETYVKGPG